MKLIIITLCMLLNSCVHVTIPLAGSNVVQVHIVKTAIGDSTVTGSDIGELKAILDQKGGETTATATK